MARDGTGNFSLLGVLAPPGTTSDPTAINAIMDDIKTALTESINTAGTKPWAANQAMASFKFTGMGDGSAATDSVPLGQAQKGHKNLASAVGGTVDAIALTFSPAFTSLSTGMEIKWVSGGANTITAPTIATDAIGGTKILKKGASVALLVGDTGVSGYINRAIYNGTDWIHQNPASAGGAASDTVSGIVELATTAEVVTGTDTARAVTPAGMAAANVVDVQTFTATGAGTWTKPTSVRHTMCHVQVWGAGGSGGKGRATSAGGGAGGGGYVEKTFVLSDLAATETISIGTGGAAQTVADSDGNQGGNTTFGAAATLVTAYGGGGGGGIEITGSNPGGMGGGPGSAGILGFANQLNRTATNEGIGGSSGQVAVSGAGAFHILTYINGWPTTHNGAGGGASTAEAAAAAGVGGSSIYGGGGGGAGGEDSSPGGGAGGASQFGGAGGAGAFDANAATAGSQPGGGGGGSETGTSGAGGNGKAIITCW